MYQLHVCICLEIVNLLEDLHLTLNLFIFNYFGCLNFKPIKHKYKNKYKYGP